MLPSLPTSNIDLTELKADSKAILAEIRELSERLAIHVTKETALETKVYKLDMAIFGDGTKDNPGHISETNYRLGEIERTQRSWSKAVWAIVTPILGLLGIGIVILLAMALTK